MRVTVYIEECLEKVLQIISPSFTVTVKHVRIYKSKTWHEFELRKF